MVLGYRAAREPRRGMFESMAVVRGGVRDALTRYPSSRAGAPHSVLASGAVRGVSSGPGSTLS